MGFLSTSKMHNFTPKMHILTLKMHFLTLKMHILTLKMHFFDKKMHFLVPKKILKFFHPGFLKTSKNHNFTPKMHLLTLKMHILTPKKCNLPLKEWHLGVKMANFPLKVSILKEMMVEGGWGHIWKTYVHIVFAILNSRLIDG